MKKNYFLLIALFILNNVVSQIVNIPDANFKAKLLAASSSNTTAKNLAGNYFKVDANSDGQIQESEALLLKELDVSFTAINSLVGITSFTNIQVLNCYTNLLSSLDVTGLTNLKSLNCTNNKLTSFNVSSLENLQYLWCDQNLLTTLNVTGLNNLETFNCGFNQLTELDVSSLSKLKELVCEQNKLTALNLSGLSTLITLRSQENLLTSINFNGANNLEIIDVLGNDLSILNLTGLSKLKYLECDGNQLDNLDLTGLNNLLVLIISGNNISSIEVSHLTNLEYFSCYGNKLTSLDVSSLVNLGTLICHDNKLTNLTIGDVVLKELDCSSNLLEVLVVKNVFNLNCSHNNLTTLTTEFIRDLDCSFNKFVTLDLRTIKTFYHASENSPNDFFGLNSVNFSDNPFLTNTYLKNPSESLFGIPNPPGQNNTIRYPFTNTPNLTYLCVWDYDVNNFKNKATQNGYIDCVVDSSCDSSLETIDFNFSTYFTIHPNPVDTFLSLTVKNEILIKSIAVYDMLGQLVLVLPTNKEISNIDVSSLRTGNYIIKIDTNKGISRSKFIKN
ncbi:T9SS type A sorting domain-containing protein [Flavobacterium sp. NG2]|uniref:T9SS type A sorting domain-containing protein n=1 Tax=Flavobacterium sp. NG2 TaxID=3097547 RepID=UPI002A83CE5A|nr:T9SS type A sorting domain-containing protein [Flavobacterium sp. NG2]WPR70740.1 T9SS type A sorting domain-containing protein [Flavobacterium sp. NG2]